MMSELIKIKVPGDKSISHRAAMLSSISEGKVNIKGYLESEDCLNTLKIVESLGVTVEKTEDGIAISGRGLRGLKGAQGDLDVGNSGTGIRLFSGMLAGQDFDSVLTGDEQIRRRPMDRVIEPLRLMGAEIEGDDGGARAPLRIKGQRGEGPLKGISYDMPVKSAQVKSAILLAGLYSDGELIIKEKIKTRDHTERMLRCFGIPLDEDGNSLRMSGGGALEASDITIPGDFSAAAFSIITALMHRDCKMRISGVGLNPTRLGLIDVLRRMGARIDCQVEDERNNEPIGTVTVESSDLNAIELTQDEIDRSIDELPLVALAASQAEGTTVIKGAGELRFKESDRIKSTLEMLRSLGGEGEELEDGLMIKGPSTLRGGTVRTFGDHRIAMASLSAGLGAGFEVELDDCQCVNTSFPGFSLHLNELRSKIG